MTRRWKDRQGVLAPDDLRRLEAWASLYPTWVISRREDGAWVAARRRALTPAEEQAGLTARLTAATLAKLGWLLADQDHRSMLTRPWLISVRAPAAPDPRP
ncbi:hypothetical protein [Bailinhaonella thermotolerans]|uniref:Uncharacterized protein n=1 Tax=Bailinhaonella thermotolerans TaxID=1070861 RepID=A0A3A4B9Q5_9ACTN|nr:hypothetical protein [Bailinhaonella thermotolerans]RJL35619.1 hypothetical protein D5H75_02185 [Bailinhaonella thermotolerans]